jgi:hypothetical protein
MSAAPDERSTHGLWRSLALLLVAFFALPFTIAMLLSYALPDLVGWLVLAGIVTLFIAWIVGGGAASHSRPRNYVVNARFTSTEQRYRIEAMTGSLPTMLAFGCLGVALMAGAAAGYELSATI